MFIWIDFYGRHVYICDTEPQGVYFISGPPSLTIPMKFLATILKPVVMEKNLENLKKEVYKKWKVDLRNKNT